MLPLGNKILVKDVEEKEKKTEAGLILDLVKSPLKKVKVVAVSPDSQSKLKKGDTCLSSHGGIEVEKGLWLCQESLLEMKL
jgi:co-chaperonin GroES (HSP10)